MNFNLTKQKLISTNNNKMSSDKRSFQSFKDVELEGVDINSLLQKDDNREIVENIFKRLQFGAQKYNSGVNVDTDTTNFHTSENSWIEMAMEEALDQLIYTTASLIRLKRQIQAKGLLS